MTLAYCLLEFGGSLFVREEKECFPAGCSIRYVPLVMRKACAAQWELCRGDWGWELRICGGKAAFGRFLQIPAGMRGNGLGTWFMCSLVKNAIALGFAEASVRGLHLVKRHDSSLRNAFYRNLGFDVVLYRDGSGFARAARIGQLRVAHDPLKVRERRMPVGLAAVFGLGGAATSVSPSASAPL